MKSCLPRERIESAVLGEAPEGLLPEIEAHSESCARCRHELSWLRSEVTLFSQRAAREEVSRLWEGVVERRSERRPGRLARGLLAAAVTLLVAVSFSGRFFHRPHAREGAETAPMSLETMSIDHAQLASAEVASMPCYTPGSGFACE